MDEEIVFEVETVLGVTVVLDAGTWAWISQRKHKDVSGMLAEVQLAVSNPDEIRRSRSNDIAYLYYRVQGARSFICVVTHATNDRQARVTTAYSSTRVKPGELVWQR